MKLFSVEFSAPVTVVVGVVILSSGLALRTNAAKLVSSLAAQEPAQPATSTVPVSAPQPDGYGTWSTDCARKVHACEYTYATKDGGKSTQTVVIHYGDTDRCGWAYYFNADKKPWARVAVPGNPKYDPKEMSWQKLSAKGDCYEDFPTKGFCPAPKDGKGAIPALPLPPK